MKIITCCLWLMIISLAFTFPVSAQTVTWDDLMQSGNQALTQNRPAEAEQSFRDALKLIEKSGDKDPRKPVTLIKLAAACDLQSKRDEAETLANQSLLALEKVPLLSKTQGTTDALAGVNVTLQLYDQAAGLFVSHQKYAEAETTYQKAITYCDKTLSLASNSKSNDELVKSLALLTTDVEQGQANAHDKLGSVYFLQKKYDLAEVAFHKSLKLREKLFQPTSSPIAESLANLATLFAVQAKYDKAEPLYKQALDIFEQTNSMNQPKALYILGNYVLLLKKTGREAEAKALLEKTKAQSK
ncbi:MAG TPA: tetratricopeptide repeat protein [Acidobacteriota bacterium]|nr:tetratricopeptide repeat protein [Acidobacteriota bacterium]